ncbi:formylglycine-generating enzyme family protein, partial [Acidobacteriota bacterium]
AEFRIFVEETGYKTSAEGPKNWKKQLELLEVYWKLSEDTEKNKTEISEISRETLYYGGSGLWESEKNTWDYSVDLYWQNPGFKQTDVNPVTCISWTDAIRYCNWLSSRDNLPAAYDIDTEELLDEYGKSTKNVRKVNGYRLPTEAEWEYAARERGKKIRFGNGENIARSSQINFDAGRSDYLYLEKGEFRKSTMPVASFKPNSLGLYDISGNVWEWCSDYYGSYSGESQINPYKSTGFSRVLRGGRWGGDAFEIRVFFRDDYLSNNRCNNSGFRIARTK